ncbi:uncharacterized protein LOC101853453 [Aplysia californica]|uniref:Uncharacterized protein LOC101853453 n=1 Tax=Aplysia californica TaxID=6500 RepID=A0ABM0ZX68_APLCA|nr:uncharacterized protein LOC101853453 [Aplysia californica]
MASPNSTEKHAVEDIPFPEVPPEVTSKLLVKDQISEMKEWFKAFAEQNHTVRDYRKYFKPVLCYLEGTWNTSDKFDEPFKSDRHALDASSWEELTGKLRFSTYTGTKSHSESFAYLPTTLMSIDETTGRPQYAQWNYRILCSPLQEDVPLSDLRPIEDLSYRVATGHSNDWILNNRRARFTFFEKDEEKFPDYTKLDRLFHTVPGLDNGPANLNQASSDDKILDMSPGSDQPLNTGYYHRMYKTDKAGVSGVKKTFRGFNDPNLWVAETSQEDVAPMSIKSCNKDLATTTCQTKKARFSYAIPLEIIYMTPLLSWNPYNLTIHERGVETATAGSRDGGLTKEKAYNGVNFSHYYMTPAEFFSGPVDLSDPADSVRSSVGVLDQNGDLKVTTGSGFRILLQAIDGVGPVRLRYPIAPVHSEGSTVYKELKALRTKLVGENLSSL